MKHKIWGFTAFFICCWLVFVARHHPPSRRKIKEIWHGRVFWDKESNTSMLRSSSEVNETPTNLDELTVTPPKIVVTESTNQDDTSEVAQPVKNQTPNIKNTDTPSQSDSKNIILTSVYSYREDPQRGRKIECGFDYIANFYNSVYFYEMRAVIMHDCYSEQFVKQYETDKIAFVRVNSPDKSMSTNDFRLKRYNSYLKENRHSYYMFVDASDVFFNGNPFNYMKNHEHGHTLFMSPDLGNFHRNAWRVKKCYKKAGELWDQNVKMHNAGVWGGDHETSQCILDCVVNQFETTLKGINNCNMPALNWCVHFGGCTDENTVEDKPDFVNPFRKECRHPHLVVHNKCKDTERKVCLVQKEGKLTFSPKSEKCNRIRFFVKKLKMNKINGYNSIKIKLTPSQILELEFTSLSKLYDAAVELKKPTSYFPKPISLNLKDKTIRETFITDNEKKRLKLTEVEFKRQINDVVDIMKYAGVRHLDLGGHCKNVMLTSDFGTIQIFDFDMSAQCSKYADLPPVDRKYCLKSNCLKNLPKNNGHGMCSWHPNDYRERLAYHGITWDEYKARLIKVFRQCIDVVTVDRGFEYRDDISKSMTGKAVEIGTYNGDFAEKNLRNFKGDYYMVDIAVRNELQVRLNSWRNEPHIHFLKMKSTEAADTFKDESLDWVYIDARHDYESVLEDMNAWWPKVKQGGLFSGHDYCASKKDRQKYPHLPWCGIYQNTPKDAYRAGTEKASQLGSSRAVTTFGQEHSLNIMHTWEGRESLDSAGTSRNPSWYVFKPSGNTFDDTSDSKVHICLAADKSHEVGISALIRSIKKNTKTPDNVIFHKFSLDSEYTLQDVQPYINSKFSVTDRGNLKSPANYVRFILAQKLPQVDACWWIDADVIVQGDIVEYTKNIRLNKLVAAFPRDSSHLSDKVYSIMKKEGLTVSSSKKGFNAGIIYLNLALWRERNIDTTIRKICAANSKYSLWSKFGSQPPLQLVAGDDMVFMDTKNYADGLGWKKGRAISPKTMFLHWNGKHKPWLPDGWYKNVWEPFSPKDDANHDIQLTKKQVHNTVNKKKGTKGTIMTLCTSDYKDRAFKVSKHLTFWGYTLYIVPIDWEPTNIESFMYNFITTPTKPSKFEGKKNILLFKVSAIEEMLRKIPENTQLLWLDADITVLKNPSEIISKHISNKCDISTTIRDDSRILQKLALGAIVLSNNPNTRTVFKSAMDSLQIGCCSVIHKKIPWFQDQISIYKAIQKHPETNLCGLTDNEHLIGRPHGGFKHKPSVDSTVVLYSGRPLPKEVIQIQEKTYNPHVYCVLPVINNLDSINMVRNTWGSKCDKLFFCASEKIEIISNEKTEVVHLNNVLKASDNKHEDMFDKLKKCFRTIVIPENENVWVLKADLDTKVNIPNLKAYIETLHPKRAFIGNRLKEPLTGTVFNSGGAGFVLSADVVENFVSTQNEKCMAEKNMSPKWSGKKRSKKGKFCDVRVAICLGSLGVYPQDTTDETEAERFHPFSPSKMKSLWKDKSSWYWTHKYDKSTLYTKNLVSEKSISFHRLENTKPVANCDIKKANSKQTFDALGKMAKCKTLKKFASGDDEKHICMDDFDSNDCTIFSLGSNNQWDFEEAVFDTTKCMVHTFDCTGDFTVPSRIKDRVKLHKTCIGNVSPYMPWDALAEKYGVPDYLKMDIEGWEWSILKQIAKSRLRPKQVGVELHLCSYFSPNNTPGLPWVNTGIKARHKIPEKTVYYKVNNPKQHIQQLITDLNAELIDRRDNPYCAHCSEIVLRFDNQRDLDAEKAVKLDITEWCKTHNVLPNGAFCSKKYAGMDKNLAPALLKVLGNTIGDFGAGGGWYTDFFNKNGRQSSAYDASPTRGNMVTYMDLTEPSQFEDVYDSVLCLEVGEHIPNEKSDILLSNIVKHAKTSIVLSWAIPGQGGNGHINCQTNKWVIDKMNKLGWAFDDKKSHMLRNAAKFHWFKNTILVFLNQKKNKKENAMGLVNMFGERRNIYITANLVGGLANNMWIYQSVHGIAKHNYMVPVFNKKSYGYKALQDMFVLDDQSINDMEFTHKATYDDMCYKNGECDLPNLQESTKIGKHLQSIHFFRPMGKTLKDFYTIKAKHKQDALELIKNTDACIHVRIFPESHLKMGNNICPTMDKVIDIVTKFANQMKRIKIFSNDLDFIKKHISTNSWVSFADSDASETTRYRDFAALTMCNDLIVTCGTFSGMAAALHSGNGDVYYFNDPWFETTYGKEFISHWRPVSKLTEDLIPFVDTNECGGLCKWGYGDFSQGPFFEHRRVQDLSCTKIFSDDVFTARGHGEKHSPKQIPLELQNEYTNDGRIPVSTYYFDQTYFGQKALVSTWSKGMVEDMRAKAEKGVLSGTYGISETNHLRSALKHAAGVRDGRVLVIGSENPWVEACVLEAGAKSVVTLEYGQIDSGHPQISTVTPIQFRDMYNQGLIDPFDAVVTFSSVEHSGLGRYGDALNPWADVLEIARAWCVCKEGGSLTIAVLYGSDSIRFNADRSYGKIRWPYLTTNWKQHYREDSGRQRVHVFTKNL